MLKRFRGIVKNRRAEGYIDVVVLVLCAVLMLALAIRILPVFVAKQQLDTFATELVREAEVTGRVGSETSRRAAVLREKTGIDPDISWSTGGRIQLNEEVTVTLTLRRNIGLFGGSAPFPLPCRLRPPENQKSIGNEVRMQLAEKIRQIIKDRRGVSFPLVIGVTLALVILLCGLSEYFRLQIIAAGVKEAVEDAIISTVNDNYAGVYHGVREGYSGGYLPDGDTGWETAVSESDIYTYLDSTIGTESRGGRHIKYVGDSGGAMEFAVDSLTVTIRNAPLAPSDPQNAQRFEADAVIRLEAPVRFGGRLLPSMHITLKVQAGYIEVF